jgi:hypothetical protein
MTDQLLPPLLMVFKESNQGGSEWKIMAALLVFTSILLFHNKKKKSKPVNQLKSKNKRKEQWQRNLFKGKFRDSKFTFGDFLILLLLIGIGVGMVIVLKFLGLLILIGCIIGVIILYKKENSQ